MAPTPTDQDVTEALRPLPRGAAGLARVGSIPQLGPRTRPRGLAGSFTRGSDGAAVEGATTQVGTAGAPTDRPRPGAESGLVGAGPRPTGADGLLPSGYLASAPIRPATTPPQARVRPAVADVVVPAERSRPDLSGRRADRIDRSKARSTASQPLARAAAATSAVGAVRGASARTSPGASGSVSREIARAAAESQRAMAAEQAAARAAERSRVRTRRPRADAGADASSPIAASPSVAPPGTSPDPSSGGDPAEVAGLRAAVARLETASQERAKTEQRLLELLEAAERRPTDASGSTPSTARLGVLGAATGAVALGLAGAAGAAGSRSGTEPGSVRTKLARSAAARDAVRRREDDIERVGAAAWTPGHLDSSVTPRIRAGRPDVSALPVVAPPSGGVGRAASGPGAEEAPVAATGAADDHTDAAGAQDAAATASEAASAAAQAKTDAEAATTETHAVLEEAEQALEAARASARRADAELAASYAALRRGADAVPTGRGGAALPRAIATATSAAVVGVASVPVAPAGVTTGRARSAAVTAAAQQGSLAQAGQTHVQKQLAASRARHKLRTARDEAIEARAEGASESGPRRAGSSLLAIGAPTDRGPAAATEAITQTAKRLKSRGGRTDQKQQALEDELVDLVEKVDPAAASKLRAQSKRSDFTTEDLVKAAEKTVKEHDRRRPGGVASQSLLDAGEASGGDDLAAKTAARMSAAAAVAVAGTRLDQSRAAESARPTPSDPGPRRRGLLPAALARRSEKKAASTGATGATGAPTRPRGRARAGAVTALPVAMAAQSLVQRQMQLARARHAERGAGGTARSADLTASPSTTAPAGAAPAAATGASPGITGPVAPAAGWLRGEVPTSAGGDGAPSLPGRLATMRPGTQGLPVAGAARLVDRQPSAPAAATEEPAAPTKGAGAMAALGGISAAAMAARLMKSGGRRGTGDFDDDLAVRKVARTTTPATTRTSREKPPRAPKPPTTSERLDLTEEIIRSVEQRVLEELDRRGLLSRGDLW